MIVGLGLDVTELDRLQTVLDRYGERFLHRILTPAERAALPVYRLPRLAGLFAAKEAAVKALGTGFSQGIGFSHLEILSDPLGRPVLTLSGPARAQADALGATAWHVSITHGRTTAAAVVVMEGEGRKEASGGRGHDAPGPLAPRQMGK